MRILVINSGSSSLKYRLFDMAGERVLLDGVMQGIGAAEGRLHHRSRGVPVQEQVLRLADHDQAFALLARFLVQKQDAGGPDAVGHRIVHGGGRFWEAVRIDAEVLDALQALTPLAPLHNPPGLAGIRRCQALFPGVPQVAAFDTAFHHTLSPAAFRYAVPEAWYRDHGVRRYGFHGLSHAWLVRRAAAWLDKRPEQVNLITLHLGNGASACAVAGGRSVDTSMGMTPLEGLVMGSRSGDLDPAVVFHLLRAGHTPEAVETALNRDSGLEGLCGSNDLRAIIARAEAGEAAANLALEIYCRRVRKYIGAYLALLGRVDALVFSGGVGENAAPVRARSCEGLEHLGIRLDESRNEAALEDEVVAIHAQESSLKILVIRADEEREIARQVQACLAEQVPGP